MHQQNILGQIFKAQEPISWISLWYISVYERCKCRLHKLLVCLFVSGIYLSIDITATLGSSAIYVPGFT